MFKALFLTSWLPEAHVFPHGLGVRLSGGTLWQGTHCSYCRAANVQPNAVGFAPFHQHHGPETYLLQLLLRKR